MPVMHMNKTTSAAKRYLIDTNIFLRTLVREDERSNAACRSFLQAVRSRRVAAYTSPLVIAEIAWTLKSFYKLPKDELLQALESVLVLRGLRVEAHEQVGKAVALYRSYNVKFVDALLASAPRVCSGSVVVVSYDREFDTIDGVVRMEPQEVVAAR